MIFDHVQLIKIVVSNTSTDESINTALRELTFAVTDKNNNYDNEREVVSAIIDASFNLLDRKYDIDELTYKTLIQCINTLLELTSTSYDYGSMILRVCIVCICNMIVIFNLLTQIHIY